MPGIRILNRPSIDGFRQDAQGVTATATNLDSGEGATIRARFLIGCDGGRPAIRKAIGASSVGDAVVQRVQSTFIRAPRPLDLLKGPPELGRPACGERGCQYGATRWVAV